MKYEKRTTDRANYCFACWQDFVRLSRAEEESLAEYYQYLGLKGYEHLLPKFELKNYVKKDK